MPITLDGETMDFYREVSKFANVTMNQAFNVVLAIQVLKMKRDNPEAFK